MDTTSWSKLDGYFESEQYKRLKAYFDAINEEDPKKLSNEIENNPQFINAKHAFFGITPLMCAARVGSFDSTVKLATKLEIEQINEKNALGKTALHEALSNGHTDVAQYLIYAGADISLEDNKGESAQNIADKKGFKLKKA